jgi:hypothetical protein
MAVIRGGLNGQTIFNIKDFDVCRDKAHSVLHYSLTSSGKIKLNFFIIIQNREISLRYELLKNPKELPKLHGIDVPFPVVV